MKDFTSPGSGDTLDRDTVRIPRIFDLRASLCFEAVVEACTHPHARC